MKKVFILIPSVLILLSMIGCASPPDLRSHNSMQSANPINKISIIGYSRVDWPRTWGGEPVLGLKSSQAAIENLVPLARTVLEKKGYVVTFAEPIAIGFPWPNRKENIVYVDYDQQGTDDKWTQTDDLPAHIYPVLESNPEAKQSAITILRELEDSISKRQTWGFKPDVESVKTLVAGTNSDTVCVLRAWGHRFSQARAVGAFFLGVLTGSVANTSDVGETVFACISGEDGTVLWQKAYRLSDDPMDIKQPEVEAGLKLFPAANMSLPTSCKLAENATHPNLYNCN